MNPELRLGLFHFVRVDRVATRRPKPVEGQSLCARGACVERTFHDTRSEGSGERPPDQTSRRRRESAADSTSPLRFTSLAACLPLGSTLALA